MATKKAGTTAKRAAAKRPTSSKTTTKVTTVAASAGTHKSRNVSSWWVVKEDRNTTALVAACVAELLGTAVLTAILLTVQYNELYAAFGAVAVVLGFGALAGTYFNPALTIGAWVTKRISGLRGLLYVIAEVLGGMLALVVTNTFVQESAPKLTDQMKAMGQSAPEIYHAAALPDHHQWLVLFAELVGTAILAFIVASAVSEKRKSLTTAVTYGFGLLAALIVAAAATASLASQGTGVTFLNPAVAIGAQIFADGVASWWSAFVWLIVPLIGGVVGFGLYETLKPSRYLNR